MGLRILAGTANAGLAENVAGKIGVQAIAHIAERFPDGELHIEVQESVRGDDVYIIQPTSPPVDEHLFELLLMADACRRAGADHLTAVIPYLGYARQDRRSRSREPLSARLVADLINASGFQRVVAVDLHSPAVESAFTTPVDHVSAVPILAEAARPSIHEKAVVVSPDLGAVKLAERYAKLLNLPVAIIHKTRVSATEVSIQRIIGDVRDMEVLVTDDMISTGGTIEKAIEALLQAGCSPTGVRVVATHGLLVDPAANRLRKLPVEMIYISDSVPKPDSFPVALQVCSLASLLAEMIQRLHHKQSIAGLVGR